MNGEGVFRLEYSALKERKVGNQNLSDRIKNKCGVEKSAHDRKRREDINKDQSSLCHISTWGTG